MTEHKREDWRNCHNCVHETVCRFNCVHETICKFALNGKDCEHHIYNADPKIYGDLQELIEPVCEWVRTHYPSEGKLIVDKCSATLEIPIHSVYSFEYIPEHIQKESDAE